MKEFRCKFCHRLLAKIGEAKLVEIKCPKCKTLNTWNEDAVYIVEIDERVLNKRFSEGQIKDDCVEQ